MSGYHDSQAGSQFTFDDEIMDMDMSHSSCAPSSAYIQQPQRQQQYPAIYQPRPAVYNGHIFDQAMGSAISPQQLSQYSHMSTMSSSSGGTSFRSSGDSMFSQWPVRDSMASGSSSWSHASDFSRDQYISETEQVLSHGTSTRQRLLQKPRDSPVSPPPRTRPAQRQTVSEKDYFRSCVSTNKQSRSCNKEHKYFCTICKKTFVSKADWKRHEETYQERTEKFQCDNCAAIYFLDKDFVAHHVKSHQCATCSDNTKCSLKRHVKEARKSRRARTGWGCGFCCHFSDDWTERCNHIAYHVEKKGKTVSDWYHSMVIYSLLQRPVIQVKWNKLLESRQERNPKFAWNEHSTGRVEGYPESNAIPQLQDQLEYYTPDQDAASLALLAFDKLASAKLRSTPPPVPPKDRRMTSLDDLTHTLDAWAQMIDTMCPDTNLPTGINFLEDFHVDF
ncbi:hypothetical protein T440DRAFT_471942 [Plenodomus tracheiphilus IPT5]|uniref:C2H2-type domain-containing protein n=1 Tax=Plenodomus tracheiphilus IPT5 TaxID=1408161 RepID=A0A6A7ASQ8_9PLEO|nr:hypothetical protein T440DRAFT_471942 [Plenodomus tracheiphilus IPT5]